MRRAFRFVPPGKTKLERAILVEQYRTLSRLIPLMYALVFADAMFLSFAAYEIAPAGLSLGVPLALGAAAAIRSAFWVRRRRHGVPNVRRIRRYLLGTTIVAALLSLAFGGWGVALYQHLDLSGRACIGLYAFIGTISCCYCLQSLPNAARLVLVCGSLPITLCLMVSHNWLLTGLSVDIIVVSAVIMRMFSASYSSFIDVLASRLEMHTEQRRARLAEGRAHQLAYHDPLTGLPNRRALEEFLGVAAAGMGSASCFGLLIVDLDRFKAVNDVHGHPAGDQLLREVARRLRDIVGEEGQSYRLGGDEFAVAVPFVPGGSDRVLAVAHGIVRALEEPFAIAGRTHHIGASVGIALSPDDGEGAETLMRRADVALYKAKESGRGCYCAFAPRMDAEIRRRSMIEAEMRVALATGQFYPCYQPIVELASGGVVGFELLARWRRPAGAGIGPDQFIPIAEECGLINELMLHLLERACIETRGWPSECAVAVNVSPVQLKDGWLAQKMLAILARTGFPPHRLTVEITENALIVDADNAKQVVESLKNQGIQLSLDDFGTGYSSIQHLRMLPFDKIKIDRSFVESLDRDADAMKMVRGIIGLAAMLELTVIAEGIEQVETATRLRRLGCAQGQGYLFGHPMTAEEVEGWLRGRGFGEAAAVGRM